MLLKMFWGILEEMLLDMLFAGPKAFSKAFLKAYFVTVAHFAATGSLESMTMRCRCICKTSWAWGNGDAMFRIYIYIYNL